MEKEIVSLLNEMSENAVTLERCCGLAVVLRDNYFEEQPETSTEMTAFGHKYEAIDNLLSAVQDKAIEAKRNQLKMIDKLTDLFNDYRTTVGKLK